MKDSIYEANYKRLEALGIVTPDGTLRPDGRSKSDGYMDLVYERLEYMEDLLTPGSIAISLAHYFKQNGDLCQDPEMVVLVYPESRQAEAFSFQQAIPSIYQEVYPEPGKVAPKAKEALNGFLGTWLENLVHQGHRKSWFND